MKTIWTVVCSVWFLCYPEVAVLAVSWSSLKPEVPSYIRVADFQYFLLLSFVLFALQVLSRVADFKYFYPFLFVVLLCQWFADLNEFEGTTNLNDSLWSLKDKSTPVYPVGFRIQLGRTFFDRNDGIIPVLHAFRHISYYNLLNECLPLETR
jgi:hypothetical protein